MKRTVYIATFFVAGCVACDTASEYNRTIHTIDSLSGAVNAMASQVQVIDTVLLERLLNKYVYYSQFVKQQVNDTLTREEADQLKQFYEGGMALRDFKRNRSAILARAALINSQLSRLAGDAHEKSLNIESLSRFTMQEKFEATKLIETGYVQQKEYLQQLVQYRNAVKGVEELLRTRNNSQLPTIVKDTTGY
jgi:hypothetical protein